jgi:hypothetical protein
LRRRDFIKGMISQYLKEEMKMILGVQKEDQGVQREMIR